VTRPTRAVRVKHYISLLDVYDRMRGGELLAAEDVQAAIGINKMDAGSIWRHLLKERLPARAVTFEAVPIALAFPVPPEGLTRSELRLYEALAEAWPVPASAPELYARMWDIPIEQATATATAITAHMSNMRAKGVPVVCERNAGYLLGVLPRAADRTHQDSLPVAAGSSR
jgi:hypothetical protein